eukprot:1141545-Pelagomonas_calceolata.AAC.1
MMNGSLGVKRNTTNWADLGRLGYGHQTLQNCWFRAALKLLSGGAISINDYGVDSRYRLQGVWREAESVDSRGNNNKP